MVDFPTTYFGEVRKVGKTTSSRIPTTTPYGVWGVWWGESSPSSVWMAWSLKKQAGYRHQGEGRNGHAGQARGAPS